MVVRRSATPEVAYHDQLDGPPREASGPAPDLQADFPRSLASSKMAKIVDFAAFKFKLQFYIFPCSLFAAAPSSSSSGRSGELARRVAHSAGHNTQVTLTGPVNLM